MFVLAARRRNYNTDDAAPTVDISRNADIFSAMTTTALDISRAATLFHALSDEARVEIVATLLGGERCVCDLMEVVGAAQSRLSYHLKVLRDAGLVSDRREGRWSYYTLEREAIVEAEALLASLRPRASRANRSGCC
jgi:ArsR family transcriptional regulator, arsenate/arsenite/antimonite-responsive transcriptional repressor